jgi:hypothetical protein
MSFRSSHFERDRDGTLVVRLLPEEAALLRQLAGELTDVFEHGPDDEALRDRLFPRAYLDPTEEAAEEEWQRFVHPDLVASRLDALRLLVDTLPSEPSKRGRVEGRLDEEQEAAWLGVLNDARLTLGTRLGVTDDDDDPFDVAEDDPMYVAWNVYGWLTALQGDLVQVLLAGMPVDGE